MSNDKASMTFSSFPSLLSLSFFGIHIDLSKLKGILSFYALILLIVIFGFGLCFIFDFFQFNPLTLGWLEIKFNVFFSSNGVIMFL
jgi:hypothetical protein